VTIRTSFAGIAGTLVGLWPAGLLIDGPDFYQLPGALVIGFCLGAIAGRSRRRVWFLGLAAGLAAGFGFHLLMVGTEWRFMSYAFELALPFIASAIAGVITRFALEHLVSDVPLIPDH
jgi:hypothetical protein